MISAGLWEAFGHRLVLALPLASFCNYDCVRPSIVQGANHSRKSHVIWTANAFLAEAHNTDLANGCGINAQYTNVMTELSAGPLERTVF